jgi:hypothetical protein
MCRVTADGPRVPSGTNLILEAADKAGRLPRGITALRVQMIWQPAAKIERRQP